MGSDLLVRNRTIDSTVGFEVLTPMQTGGLTLLVDRGWVPNAADAETSPPVDPAPSGPVQVTGWLRTGEVSLDRNLPPPQLASISLADARARMPSLSAVDTYVVLGAQQPDRRRGRPSAAPAAPTRGGPGTAPGVRVPVVALHAGRSRLHLLRDPPRGDCDTGRLVPTPQRPA